MNGCKNMSSINLFLDKLRFCILNLERQVCLGKWKVILDRPIKQSLYKDTEWSYQIFSNLFEK